MLPVTSIRPLICRRRLIELHQRVCQCHNSCARHGPRLTRFWRSALLLAAPVGLASGSYLAATVFCQCQVASTNTDVNQSSSSSLPALQQHEFAAAAFLSLEKEHRTFLRRTLWNLYVFSRFVRFCAFFLPVLCSYPFLKWTDLTKELWWRMFIFSIKANGPTVTKLGQWAASRRDIFSAEFCMRLGQLQRSARTKPWAETERILAETFGCEWRSLFLQFDPNPIGSGCIAQVFKAVIDPIAFEHKTKARIKVLDEKVYLPVAVKVAHGSVIDEIRVDMALLRLGARVLQWVMPSLNYLSLLRCLDEFSAIMEKQVDMRHEGRSLLRLARNFAKVNNVRFPQPLLYTDRILIETFEEGMHISHFVPRDGKEILSAESRHLNEHLAKTGVRSVCQMIFADNFVHGDLHPGNILVQNHDRWSDPSQLPWTLRIHRKMRQMCFHVSNMVRKLVGDSELTNVILCCDERMPDPTLVFLDTGITVELSARDLQNFRAVFRALIMGDGEKIARLLISQSPHLQHFCDDEDQFCADMSKMVTDCVLKGGKRVALKDFDISRMLTDLLSIVSTHKVMLEPNFTCVVLAILVLEGLGRSLDPDIDLLDSAKTFLFKAAVG